MREIHWHKPLEDLTPSYDDPQYKSRRPSAQTLVYYRTSLSLAYRTLDEDGGTLEGHPLDMLFVARINDDGNTFVVRCMPAAEAEALIKPEDGELHPFWYQRVVEAAFEHGKPVFVYDADKLFKWLAHDYDMDSADEF